MAKLKIYDDARGRVYRAIGSDTNGMLTYAFYTNQFVQSKQPFNTLQVLQSYSTSNTDSRIKVQWKQEQQAGRLVLVSDNGNVGSPLLSFPLLPNAVGRALCFGNSYDYNTEFFVGYAYHNIIDSGKPYAWNMLIKSITISIDGDGDL